MSDYRPDRWVVIKVTSKEFGDIYKILASWVGGYTTGDSWKISSGLALGFRIDEKGWLVSPQTSGSIYYCHPESYGTTMYSFSIFSDFKEKLNEIGNDIFILEESEAISVLKSYSLV